MTDFNFFDDDPFCPDKNIDHRTLDEIFEQRTGIRQRLLETYRHGLEEVDISPFFAGRSERENQMIAGSVDSIMLSSFCRGGCGECGLNAKPYSRQNRKILKLEPLKESLSRYQFSPLGQIVLHDASDPLDYPYLLELLEFLEHNPHINEVRILTSCPPGAEEVFDELLKANFSKMRLSLSVLPSTRERLNKSGVHTKAVRASFSDYQEKAKLFRNIEPLAVGRNRKQGDLTMGFNCEDHTILTPEGIFLAEYHAASDLYPNERKLVNVDEARKVPIGNQFFSLRLSSPFSKGAKIYTPWSTYIHLDQNERTDTEIALRHLFAYLYSVYENLADGLEFNFAFINNFNLIQAALEQNRFVLPDDSKELTFYQGVIKKILLDFRKLLKETKSDPSAFLVNNFSIDLGHQIAGYQFVFDQAEEACTKHHDQIFGSSKPKT